MILKKLSSFYIVTKIKEHKKIKKKLLSLIKNIKKTKLVENKIVKVSHSDWRLPRNLNREYLTFFYNIVTPYMGNMAKLLNCKTWNITNGWFQDYQKNDFHGWHVHRDCNYTNVYYLNLTNKKDKTQIYNIVDKKIIDIDIEEGDLITFPASLIHRSDKLCAKNKTIISFNSNFDDPIL